MLQERKRVLVVEDNTLLAADLAEFLDAAGYDVIGPAQAVAEALQLLDAGHCDVAILDINLGQETSASVADKLHQRAIPIVVVSGYTGPRLSPVYYNITYLTKPFSVAAILST